MAHPPLRVLPGGTSTSDTKPVADAKPALDDEGIIDAVLRHDDRVASEIYDHLVGVVDRTLYRILGCRGPDHDDLVQQAFEQIVITLARHAFARKCSLKTWASRVATNVGLNALRSKRRERKVIDWSAESSSIELEGDLEAQLDARAQLARVRWHLASMTKAQVEVVLLHDVLGHDLHEIAIMTRLSLPAAQSRLFRGRRDLERRLAGDESLSRRQS